MGRRGNLIGGKKLLNLMALEPRMMFDGAAPAMIAAVVAEGAHDSAPAQSQEAHPAVGKTAFADVGQDASLPDLQTGNAGEHAAPFATPASDVAPSHVLVPPATGIFSGAARPDVSTTSPERGFTRSTDGSVFRVADRDLGRSGADRVTRDPIVHSYVAEYHEATTDETFVAYAADRQAIQPTEIAFVSNDVPDWERLAAGFSSNVQVIVIDGRGDGVAQIANALAGKQGISAVHIVSHGSTGAIAIGTATLNRESMEGTYRDQLAAIGRALSADGDILVYGCDFGADAAGQTAARTLSALTGADIASSSDATGSAALGGDWDLENRVGVVETASALSVANVGDYAYLLAPNRAPQGADQVIAIAEDTSYAFTNQRFGFSDVDGNALAGVIITTLPSPAEGRLLLNGVAVSAGQYVPIASFSGLVFTPTKDYNGSLVGTFTFQVVDNGGTAGGGVNVDQTPNQFRFIINPVNDTPVLTMPTSIQTTPEDTTLTFSQANGNAITLSDVDGGATDVYRLAFSVPAETGTLQLGSTVGLTTSTGNGTNSIFISGTLASINAALEGLRYVPLADYNGSAGNLNISFEAVEPGGFINGGFESPAIPNASFAQPSQDQVPGYDTTDSLGQIEIWSSGFLGVTAFEGRQFAELNANSPGTLSQTFIPSTAGEAIRFTFAHRGRAGTDVARAVATDLGADNTFGTADDRVLGTLTVTDGNTAWGQYNVDLGIASGNAIRIAFTTVSSAGPSLSVGNFIDAVNVYNASTAAKRTLTVAVTPVVDIVDDQIVTPQNTARTFNVITGANEVSGADNFENTGRTVTAINGASFTPGANIAITGGTITVQTNGNVTFTPTATFTGTTSFTYTVRSGGVFETATATINVPSNLNDPPSGTDNLITLNEDASYTFSQASFGFSDPADTPANAFQAVIITTLPPAADGRLFLNGVAVTAGQIIPVASIPNLVFTPATDRNGANIGRFTFQVRDNGGTAGGGRDTDPTPNNFAFNITPINDAPQGTDKTVTLNEDSPYGFSAADFGFSDPAEGNAFQALIITTLPTPADGVLLLRGVAVTAGQVIAVDELSSLAFIPATNRNGNGIGAFTFQVRDDGGTANGGQNTDQSPNRFAFNVVPVNDTPTDGDEAVATPEDTPVSGNVLTNATDPDGDTLSVTAFTVDINGDGVGDSFTAGQTATIAGVGTLTINANGTYTFTPALNYNGSVPVATYTVSDPSGATDISTLTITVTPVNDAPVDSDESVTISEDTSASGNVLANATDVDGNPLTVTRFVINGVTYTAGQTATIAGVGTLTINANGSYSFTPVLNYNGSVPVATYTVSDGAGGLDTSTLTITVTPVNDPPVDGDESVTTPEDTPATGNVLANASDIDGGTLTVTRFVVGGTTYTAGQTATLAGVGTLTINPNGTYTFTPALNYNGPVPVATYTVSDGAGGLDTSTLTITVTPVNDPPVDGDESVTIPEDTSGSGNVLANASDPDGDTLTVTRFVVNGVAYTAGQTATIAGIGTLTINANGAYSFTPVPNFNGNVPVATYTVSDGLGGLDTSTLAITVTPVNDPPVDGDETVTTAEDTPATGNVLDNAIDIDGNTLAITQFVVGGLTYTAGQTATLAGVGTLTINTNGAYTFTPAPNYNGSVPVATYTVSDGAGGTDTSTLTITVTPVNDVPVDGDESVTTPEDTPATGNVLTNATDVDGNPLTVTQFVVNGSTYAPGQTATIAGVGTLTIAANGAYTFTPVLNYNGPVPVATYTVSDGQGGTDTSTLTITVTPVNDPPVDGDETVTTPEDTPATGNVLANATDVDGGTLTVTRFVIGGTTYTAGQTATLAGVGTLTIDANGSYTFTPALNYNGSVPVATYTVSDGAGGLDTSTLAITVTPVNDAPVDGDESVTTPEDTPATGNVLANATDIDGGTLTVTRFVIGGTTYTAGQTATLAGVGTLTINVDGSYTFTPALNYNGSVPVATYTVSDGAGGLDTSTLTITVTPVNDPPVDGDESVTTPEDTPATGNVLANATDIDGGTLTVTRFVVGGTTYTAGQTATLAGVGALTINVDGSYTFTPALNYNGSVPVATYTVSDGAGGLDTSTLTITVTPVNDPPVDGDENVTTAEDTPATGNVLTNATDVEGNTLTVTQFVVGGVSYTAGQTATLPGVGTLTINANGSYTFAPAPNYNGSVPVATYTVSDGQGGTDTSTLTITVTSVNDAPVDGDESNGTPRDVTLVVTDGSPGDLLNNASDADGGTLTITQFVVNGTTYTAGQMAVIAGVGELTIRADGSYTFVPVPLYVGNVPTVTYTVSDGQGGTDTSTLSLTVTPVNDAPVDGNETNSTPEDTTLTVADGAPGDLLNNASDFNNDPLIITQFVVNGSTYAAGQAATIAGIGTLTINANGSYSFTPVANYNGPIPVATYTVSDGRGGIDTSTLTLTVTPVNDAPVDGDETNTTPEDTVLTVADGDGGDLLTNATDVDGDVLTVTQFVVGGTTYTAGQAATIAGVGTLTINANGSYTFAPAANFNGTVPIVTYTVGDGNGGTDTSTLSITVTPINDAPVDGDETNSTPEDTTLTVADGAPGDLLNNASDLDGNTLTITQFVVGGTTYTAGQTATLTGIGTLTINANGSYSFTPVANYNGPVPVATYTVSDGAGGADTSTLTLTVTPVNDAPVDGDETNSTPEDTMLTVADGAPGDLLNNASDLDGNTLTITQFVVAGTTYTAGQTATIAGVGALTINADGSYSFAPVANYNGLVPVTTYTVSDGNGGTDTSTLTLSVTPVNDAPVDGDETNSTPEDTTLTVADGALGDLLNNATDVDGNPLTITQFVVAGQTYTAGQSANIAGVGTLTINANGSYSFTPVTNYSGTVPVATYTVSDGNGGTDTSTLTLSVTPVNDAPVDGDETNSTPEDTVLTVGNGDPGDLLNNATDLDGDALTITQFVVAGTTYTAGQAATIAGVGTLTINADGSYSFAPVANYNGPVPVATYTVSDGNGGTDKSTLTLSVTPVNDAPVDGNEAITILEDTSASGNVLTNASDVDGNPITITQFVVAGQTYAAGQVATIAGVGTLSVNVDGSFTFIPIPNFNGNLPIATYTVSDGQGGTDTSTLIITVTPVNDAPFGADKTVTIAEDAPYTFAAADFGFSDPVEGNAFAALVVTTLPSASDGVLLLNGVSVTQGQVIPVGSLSQLTFQPVADRNGNGIGSFTFQVRDDGGTANGGADTDLIANRFAFDITPVNDAPVDGNETNSTPEDTPLVVADGAPGDLLNNASDLDGDPLSITQFTVNGTTYTAGQSATIAGVGTLIINANGSYSFTPAANYNGAVPVVTYTVSDGQGGTDTSTLTLNVTPVADAPVLGGLNNGPIPGTDAAVYESDLASGTTPTGTRETTAGTFTVQAADGLVSLTVNGTVITAAQLAASGTTPIVVTTPTGQLTISGYDAATGTVSYSFTLTTRVNNAVDPVIQSIALTVTDANGAQANGSLGIQIVDDAPIVRADNDEAINRSGNPSSVATGNVVTGVDSAGDPNSSDGVADTIGADTIVNPVTGVAAGTGAPSAAALGSPLAGSYGNLTLNSDGSYSYTPDYANPVVSSLGAQQTITDTFTYQVTDADGDTVSTTLTITIFGTPAVLGLNDGAIAGTDGSVFERDLSDGTSPTGPGETLNATFMVLGSATRPLTAIEVGGTNIPIADLVASGTTPIVIATPRGTITISGYDPATGIVNYSYTLGDNVDHTPGPQVDSIRVTVFDSLNDFGSDTLDIAIIDDAPTATADTNSIGEDATAPITGSVLGNDVVGADGTTTPVSGVAAGATGTPSAGAVGTPLAGSYGALTLNANGTYSYSVNSADPVVQALGVGETLTEVYTYRITDADGSSATATLTITINGANDAPVDGNETATTPEGTPATGNVLTNGTDADGDPLTVSQFVVGGVTYTAGQTATIAGVGTLTINPNGGYTFTPLGDYNGPVPVATYTVSDGQGGTDTSTLSITVTPVNDPPVDGNESYTVNEDVPLTGNLLANASDVDGDTLSITGFAIDTDLDGTPESYAPGQTATIANVGTIVINADGTFTFTPVPNYNGPVPPATYTVSDGNGGTDTSTVTISVVPVNDAPIDGNESITTPEDRPATGNVLTNGFDVDGDPLTVTGFQLDTNGDGTPEVFTPGQSAAIPGVGTLILNADGSFTFTPAPNYNGPVPTVTYTVSDGAGGTDTSTLIITVSPVNDAPVDGNEIVTATEDTPATGNVLTNGSDPDGNPLSVTGFTIDTNGDGLSETFAPGQPAPIPGVGTLTINPDGTYNFTPAPNYNGPVPVATYTVSDGQGGTDTSTLSITVAPANDPPSDGDEVVATPEDTPATGNVLTNGFDVDGNPLSVTQFVVGGTTYTAGQTATLPGVGTLTINPNGTYNFTPVANYNGPVPIATYTVSDGQGGTDTSTLAITVTPVNDPPVDGNETVVATEDTPATGNVLTNGTDADGNPLSVTQFEIGGTTYPAGQAANIPGVGVLTINSNGSYTFTPAPNYNGPVPVATYTVSDGQGGTDTSTLAITVAPVKDPPVDGNETVLATEDTPATGNVLTNGTDVEGNPLSVTQFMIGGTTYPAGQTATLPGVGALTINPDGTYTFMPAPNYNGPVPVATYTVSDGQGGTDTSTLSITVTPVNDAPVDGNETVVATEDTPATGNVLANGTDVDGNPLSVTQFSVGGITYTAGQTATIAGVGTLIINPNGTYTFTPLPNYNGPVPTVVYTVSDGQGGTDTSTLNITVAPVNDAPVDGDETLVGAPDTPIGGNLLSNASDVDGGPLSITQFVIGGQTYTAGQTATLPGIGSVTINADGSFRFVPDRNFTGAVPPVSYVVSDGRGGTDRSTLSISIPGGTADVQQLLAIGSDPALQLDEPIDRARAELPFLGGVPRPLLEAINQIRSLGGTVELGNGPVLAAVNGARWLQGTDLDPNHPITGEVARLDRLRDFRDAGDRLVDHRWSDFAFRSSSGFSVAGDERAGIMVESVVRDNAIYIDVRDIAKDGRAAITSVTIRTRDGSDASDWLHADKRGFAIIERHAGQDELHLIIEVERSDGSRSTTGVAIQGSTGEIELDRPATDRGRDAPSATTSSALPLNDTIVTARSAAQAEAERLARAFQGPCFPGEVAA